MTRLSHSSINAFSDCPKKWKFHYVDKLRPTHYRGSFMLGTAIDNAIELLLKENDIGKAKELFMERMTHGEINKIKQELPENPLVLYSNVDLDAELLNEVQLMDLASRLPSGVNTPLEYFTFLAKKKKEVSYFGLTKPEKIFHNLANWYSLCNKGHLMIDAFVTDILPKIEGVFGTQLPLEIVNDEGDRIIGAADFVLKIKGIDTPILFDLKTSGKPYSDESVSLSQQLCLYIYALGQQYNTNTAGFIVLQKNIAKDRIKVCKECNFDGSGGRHKTCPNEIDGKRCGGEWVEVMIPKARTQMIISEIPERLTEIVTENLDLVNRSIKANIFPRSLTACKPGNGIVCPYFDLCFKDSDVGLVKLDDGEVVI